MKNCNLFFSVLFVLVVMSSCDSSGPKSVKGKWTDFDKTVFKTALEAQMKKDNPTLDAAAIAKTSDCYISKLEAEFSIDDTDKKENETKIAELITLCLTENTATTNTSAADTTATTGTDTTKAE